MTEQVGVNFLHTVQLSGEFFLPEIMGSGCAVFDANGDDLPDLYFVSTGNDAAGANRLFQRNKQGTYDDVTEASGLGNRGYGFGVATGDIDNDGDLDVYVANDGADALYTNDGTGRFKNVTQMAGIVDNEWSSSVSFLDFDLDGWLDIFVVHYVHHDPRLKCNLNNGVRDYCSPKVFSGVADRLWRNKGDGTFEDLSQASRIGTQRSNGLGVIVEDFNEDGWPDIYVTNDGQANHLWMNRREGSFENVGMAMGVAVNGQGAAEASMGVAAGDVDGDGDVDLFMTHLFNESNTVYLRDGDWGFVDASHKTGMAMPSLNYTGFGTALFDFDNDGDLDAAVVNGRVGQSRPLPGSGPDKLWRRYAEPNQIFRNLGHGTFKDMVSEGGPFTTTLEVSRGLVTADLDQDGDLDMVVTNCRGRARIYENIVPNPGHWLKVKCVDPKLHRSAFGARVYVQTADGAHKKTIRSDGGYLGASPATAHFGLDTATEVEEIQVTWPGDEKETYKGGAVDRTITLIRGEGR